MASSIGESLKLTVFGQSHSVAIGAVCEGLPAGIAVDQERLARFMARRAPGQDAWSTPRAEADEVTFVAGLNPEGVTCGTPLALIIENTNTRSGDYAELARIPRPGHADWPAYVKYGGMNDVAGGGHFSGRLTAPVCAVGGICLQVLEQRDIHIAAHLAEVAGIADEPFAAGTAPAEQKQLTSQLATLADGRRFPVISDEAAAAMQDAISEAHAAEDSVGGVVECVISGMPAGVGEPMFSGIENLIAAATFGIPAVKGIEFGSGFAGSRMRGSENNDPYTIQDGKVVPRSNNAGGILGGISTGAPIVFRLAIKPTSSIALEQDSVDLERMEPAKLRVPGRHDPCIAPRAVPVAEAIAALSMLDALLSFPAADTLDARLPRC